MADLKVFSAGVAMRLAKQAVEAFEAEHPELDVEFSGGGSVAGVNRLLGGEDLDVLILADQTAIDEQLMPDFADGYFVWGGNEMCITGKGINSDNWKEVLLDPASEVKHTNPYDDPSGYRAVMAMMLADHVEEGLSDEVYAIGFRKKDQALRDAVNSTLSAMKADGKFDEISAKWFGK